jgi:hypothetical protein
MVIWLKKLSQFIDQTKKAIIDFCIKNKNSTKIILKKMWKQLIGNILQIPSQKPWVFVNSFLSIGS